MPRRTTVTFVSALLVLGTACVSTRPEEAQCVQAPRAVLDDIATNLTVDGTLRHGSLEIRNGITFVSAELARAGDPERLRGDLLTWATGSLDSAEYFSVDAYARETSSWPAASFDAREEGVVDSRACTAYRAGTPDPSADTDAPGDAPGDDDAPTTSIGF